MRKRAEWIVLGLMLMLSVVLGGCGHGHAAVLVLALAAVLELGVWLDRRRAAAGHHGLKPERESPEPPDGDQAEPSGEAGGE